jgi:AraC-like DNA-binding protein
MLAVSSAALLEACASRGVEPAPLLAAVGVAGDAIRDPAARITTASAAALWRLAVERCGDPALALHAAEGLRFGAYRVLDYLVATAHTIGGAFEQLAAHFALINSGMRISLAPTARGTWLRLGLPAPTLLAYAEYTLAAVYLRVQASTTLAFAPLAVELAFPAPGHRAEHVRVFGCPVRFGAAESGLLIGRDVWHAENPQRDSALFAVLDRHAHQLSSQLGAERGYADQVRVAIRDQLEHGELSLRAIARRLATSTRSLQRHLELEGLAYHELVETTRRAEAQAHLLDGRLSVSEVAARVGFAQPSSFTRAFLRWTGKTPQAYRRAIAAGSAPPRPGHRG